VENNLTTDTDWNGRLDFTIPASLFSAATDFKVGARARLKKKDRANDVKIYDGFDGDLTQDQILGGFQTDDFYFNRYLVGRVSGPGETRSFTSANFSSFEFDEDGSREDSDPANYEADENVFGGYAMGTTNAGALRFNYGVRYEYTDIDYKGNEFVLDENGDYAGTTPVSGTNNYGHVLPSLNLRYALNTRSNLRLGFSRSLSRPDYYDLVPYRFVNREDEELALGNSDLKATESWNADVLFENYFQSIGVLSAGLFFKRLDNYIYVENRDQVGGSFDGWEVTQPVNGDQADLWGLEVSWNQQFTQLPGWLAGWGVFANYTYTDSEVDLPGRDEEVRFPGQANHSGNAAISYEAFGFQGRIALNYNGSYLDEVGGDADEDIFYKDHTQLDLSMSYSFWRGTSIFLEVVNLTDAPLVYYIGEESRPIQQEYYSRWASLGVKFSGMGF
jgi:TonB-dependent receptor